MTRRVLAVLVVSAFLLLLFAAPAFAAYGGSNYLTPTAGVSPHGSYQVTSNKCKVCHAVHRAGANGDGVGSEALLRSTRADACTYCHIFPGIASKVVYGGINANYNGTDYNNAHNYFGGASVACITCHQVHAAASQMTSNAALIRLILVKSGVGYDADSDPANNGVPLAGDSTQTAESKWCTRCHLYWPGSTTDTVDSHILTATVDGQHAFSASTYCESCHNSNTVKGVVTTASAFPHYTDGARFLTSALTSAGGSAGATMAADPQYDGVCLRCHRNGAGLGVGQSY